MIAERTGRYEGRTPIQWCGEDGVWKNVWLDPSRPPVAARCAVYKKGFREPLEGVAHWAEFVQKKKDGDPTQMWATKGVHMLGKVAEALALRAAFPQDLSGIFTPEETAAEEDTAAAPSGPGKTIAESVAAEYSQPSGEPMIGPAQLSEIASRIRDLGLGKDAALELYAEITGREVPVTRLLTQKEADAVLEELARRAEPAEPTGDLVDAEIVDDAPPTNEADDAQQEGGAS